MRLLTRDSLERMGVTTRSVQSERRPRVKLHPNAKTTPHMRALLVDRIRHQQWAPATAASAAGISVRRSATSRPRDDAPCQIAAVTFRSLRYRFGCPANSADSQAGI